jgi:hypothetical protein
MGNLDNVTATFGGSSGASAGLNSLKLKVRHPPVRFDGQVTYPDANFDTGSWTNSLFKRGDFSL